MRSSKEVHYTDMSEKELTFLFDALKHRVGEAEAEAKRLRGRLAKINVYKYMGEVQNASKKTG